MHHEDGRRNCAYSKCDGLIYLTLFPYMFFNSTDNNSISPFRQKVCQRILFMPGFLFTPSATRYELIFFFQQVDHDIVLSKI